MVLVLFISAVTVSAAEPIDNGDGTLTLEAGTVLAELPVKNGMEDSIPVGLDEDVTFRIPEGGWDSIVLDLPDIQEAPIQKEEVVGSFRVILPDGTETYVAIVALAEVSSTFPGWFSRYAVWICGVIMILIVILVTYLLRQRKAPAQNRAR